MDKGVTTANSIRREDVERNRGILHRTIQHDQNDGLYSNKEGNVPEVRISVDILSHKCVIR